MQAVVYPQANEMELRAVAEPAARPGEALVRVRATTICATDFKIFAGQFPGTRFPHIPGHEWSGDVIAVGSDVDEVAPGDRVGVEVHVGCGRCPRCLEGLYNLCENYGNVAKGHAHIGFTVPGGLADYCAVPVRALHKLPPNLDYDQGAMTDNVGVALWAVERARLQAGESVAVIGPGAIGLLALQVARRMGAGQLVLVGTRAERLRVAEGMGADALVNASEVDAVKTMRDLTGGRGADVVIEFAGSEQAARDALLVTRRGGRVVLGGATGPGRELKGVDLSVIVRGHLDVLGSVANPKGVSARGVTLMAKGLVDVRPLMTHHLALGEFPRAWAMARDHADGAIRVMLHPEPR
ncbi:MAG TPA: alcohol dehydrogenase catalytic domain-containing protein [Chloroflexota bacterium]|jgi:L-iditol 2-dehydrogenase